MSTSGLHLHMYTRMYPYTCNMNVRAFARARTHTHRVKVSSFLVVNFVVREQRKHWFVLSNRSSLPCFLPNVQFLFVLQAL